MAERKEWKDLSSKEKTQGVVSLLVVALFVIGAGSYMLRNSESDPTNTETSRSSSSLQVADSSSPTKQNSSSVDDGSTTTKSGTYGQYQYLIIQKSGEKRMASTFQPFLPRDDSVVLGAMKKVASDAYGGDVLGDSTPRIETLGDKNYIVFTTNSGKYYFLPIKEDTGEVHSIGFWRE